MTMRFREYLAGLSPDAQRALVDDLTLGAGRLLVAVRRQQQDAPTPTVLSTLADAFVALHAAVAALGDTEDEAAPPPATAPIDQRTERWSEVPAPAHVAAVGGLLQMAAEMARNATQAALQDRAVEDVRGLLRDARDVLAQVRDEALRPQRSLLSDAEL